MFLPRYHLIYGTGKLSEIHILLKIKLEWIDYTVIDCKITSSSFRLFIAKKQNKVVQWFVKQLIVI